MWTRTGALSPPVESRASPRLAVLWVIVPFVAVVCAVLLCPGGLRGSHRHQWLPVSRPLPAGMRTPAFHVQSAQRSGFSHYRDVAKNIGIQGDDAVFNFVEFAITNDHEQEKMVLKLQMEDNARLAYLKLAVAALSQRVLLEAFFLECLQQMELLSDKDWVALWQGSRSPEGKVPQKGSRVPNTAIERALRKSAFGIEIKLAILGSTPFPTVLPQQTLYQIVSDTIHNPSTKSVYIRSDEDVEYAAFLGKLAERYRKPTEVVDVEVAALGQELMAQQLNEQAQSSSPNPGTSTNL